jgi:hypothetical protein
MKTLSNEQLADLRAREEALRDLHSIFPKDEADVRVADIMRAFLKALGVQDETPVL